MKKHLFFLILLLFIVGCSESAEDVITKSLSELQIDACNAADNGGTCDTRLVELGIVLKEDCCEVLGKCC